MGGETMKERQGLTLKKFIAITALITILLCIYLSWDKVFYFIDSNIEEIVNEENENKYYLRIASNFNKKGIAIKRGNLQIKDLLDNDNNFGYLMDNMRICDRGWGKSGGTVSIGSLENANEDYKLIKKSNKKSDELGEYEIGVSILNWFGGNSDKAIEILENVDYLENEKLKTTRNLNLAAMYIGLSRFEEAEGLLIQDFKENDLYNYFKRDLLAYIYFLSGENNKFEEAISYNHNTLTLEGDSIKGVKFDEDEKYRLRGSLNKEVANLTPYLRLFNGPQDIFDDIKYNKEHYGDKKKTNNTLTGYVVHNGNPLRGMIVYLKSTKYKGISIGGFIDREIYGITDENGRYEIKNIPNDNYNIGLYGSWHQLKGKQVKLKRKNMTFTGNTNTNEDVQVFDPIKLKEFRYVGNDKIKVSWENPSDDGFKYSVNFGEIRDTDIGGEDIDLSYINSISTEENSIEIDLIEYKKTSIGNIYSWGPDLVEPYQVIEPLYHKGKYALRIDAHPLNEDYYYPGNDNYGIYSNRRFDAIDIEGVEWNEGDRLLLEKKYPEALKWFENKLKEDPNDIHSMKVLSVIYSKGYKGKENGGGLIGKDVKKGIKYTVMLKEKIGGTDHILSTLGDLYKLDEQYEKALEYYLKQAKDNDSYFMYRQVGNMYMKMNQWDEALENYKVYSDNNTYKDYSKVLLIGILMDDKEIIAKYSKMIESEEYAVDYSDLFNVYMNMDRGRYRELYDLINQGKIAEVKELVEDDDSDLGLLYRGLLLLSEMRRSYEEEEKIYYGLYEQQDNNDLKSLMKYFGRGEIVSNFGEGAYETER